MVMPTGDTEIRGAGSGRGIAGGYNNAPSTRDTMDKIEIATTGNSTDFGDLARYNSGGGVSSSTSGLFSGGRKETSPYSYLTVLIM